MVSAAASAGGSESQIPGYRIVGKLGKGCTACVYKALQISLDRVVAIKVLPKALSQDRQFSDRFLARAKTAVGVRHDNIVQTIYAGQTRGGFNYLVTEYVEGPTLFHAMNSPPFGIGKMLPESPALEICIQIADALSYAHEHGLICREVQPKRILLTTAGIAKLTDLGLARPTDDREAALSEHGEAYGMPYYISPEQIEGQPNINARADIYSLGATMYHLMTGRPPFVGDSPSAVLHQHLSAQLRPANLVNGALDSSISRIIGSALCKRREDRYQSMETMASDLRDYRGKI